MLNHDFFSLYTADVEEKIKRFTQYFLASISRLRVPTPLTFKSCWGAAMDVVMADCAAR
jgi:hypothetical protein